MGVAEDDGDGGPRRASAPPKAPRPSISLGLGSASMFTDTMRKQVKRVSMAASDRNSEASVSLQRFQQSLSQELLEEDEEGEEDEEDEEGEEDDEDDGVNWNLGVR